jgi:hypothetical protein
VQVESCGAAPEAHAVVTATLSSCTPRCAAVARQSVPFGPAGSLEFEGVSAGRYTVDVEPPFVKPVSLEAILGEGEESAVHVPLHAFRFFGRVTLNGKPVQARLYFESGEAQSDSTGRYTAALSADPLRNPVRVALCGERRTSRFIVEKRIVENAPYDIALDERAVAVTVVDRSGRRVRGAMVTFAPLSSRAGEEPSIHYVSAEEVTDAGGRALFAHAPSDRPLVFCAERDGYVRTCSGAVSIADAEEVTVTLDGALLRGRIAGHEGFGLVAFVDELGRMTEQAPVRADGTFELRQPHADREYVIYASSRKPLTLFPRAPVPGDDGVAVYPLPAVPVRSFSVSVSGMRTKGGFVGLWIGGRYVPVELLAFHHDHRGVDVLVERGRLVEIRDIAETGAIGVAFVPEVASTGPFVDPFTRPEYANVRRYPVIGAAVTVPAE